jgi:hypothetical protein
MYIQLKSGKGEGLLTNYDVLLYFLVNSMEKHHKIKIAEGMLRVELGFSGNKAGHDPVVQDCSIAF